MKLRKRNKLVYGVGVNDADYLTQSMVGGVSVYCSFYTRWQAMLKRCYSAKYQQTKSSYTGCTVCEDWLTFSKFKAWMEKQDWQGKELDKDLLIVGNKVYSPDTCVFVSGAINSFIINDCKTADRLLRTGSSLHIWHRKFQSQCKNPITGKLEHLGYFDSDEEAHEAWKLRKKEIAEKLYKNQLDERTFAALIARYS